MNNKIIPTEKYPNIVDATIKNLKTGEVKNLTQKIDHNKKNWSDSLFLQPIKKNGYEFKLRFDFGDKDKFGNPILDLDVFRENKKTDDFKQYHHTQKNKDVYNIIIDGFLELKLELEIVMISSIAFSAELEYPKKM